ncbi:MAG: NAD(P)/FAD-dependent oxidoreductase [bacterium]
MNALNIVIIGNSAAGLSAAETVRRYSRESKITMISDEPHHPYMRCLLTEVLAGQKTLSHLYYKPLPFYEEHNIRLLKNTQAVSIIPDREKAILKDGQEVTYDRLLVATGAADIPLGIEGEVLGGIYHLRTYSQAEAAAGAAETSHTAVVIGAGLVGLHAAYALRGRGLEVTIVDAAPHLLINQLDRESAAIMERELMKEGIRCLFGLRPKAFWPGQGKNRLGSLVTDHDREIAADMAVVSVGVRPRVELIEKAGGEVGSGIKVDPFLKTSLPDIYAAGDCIEIRDALSGKSLPSALWPLAVEQGRFAALNLLGEKRPYPSPLLSMNATQIGRIPLISVGCVNHDTCGEQLMYKDSSGKSHRKFFIRDDVLAGYILMGGDVQGAGIYTDLVKKRRPISSIRSKVLKGTVSAADLLKIR